MFQKVPVPPGCPLSALANLPAGSDGHRRQRAGWAGGVGIATLALTDKPKVVLLPRKNAGFGVLFFFFAVYFQGIPAEVQHCLSFWCPLPQPAGIYLQVLTSIRVTRTWPWFCPRGFYFCFPQWKTASQIQILKKKKQSEFKLEICFSSTVKCK